MAITKEVKADKIEVVGDWNVQVRDATIIKEDDVELTRSFHRHVFNHSVLQFKMQMMTVGHIQIQTFQVNQRKCKQ
jgi:hypothetical protein